MTISLKAATEIAQLAFSEGEKRGVVSMSVVVTDPGGHIRVAMRADPQGIFGVDTASGKARTALGFNRSSLALSKIFTDPCAVASIAAATSGRFVPLGGGVVIKNTEGAIVGAAGVSGGLPDVDEEIIVAAITAVGLQALL